MPDDEGLIQAESPSETALSESKLHEKGLCDYVVTVADGCRHGCEFCYVPSMPQIWGDPGDKFSDAGVDDPQDEWGDYALYRDDLQQHLADDLQRLDDEDWKTTRRGQGVVGISFHTDCYQDKRSAQITRQAVETLVGHDKPVRILTRNPSLLVGMHQEFYEGLPLGTVCIGSSIPGLNEQEIAAIEPDAPHIDHRIEALGSLRNVLRYVSMSPTYPTQDFSDLKRTLSELQMRVRPNVVFHEPINPRSGNIQACVEHAREDGLHELADALERITDTDEWRLYALRQLRDVQVAAKQVGQRVHLWPDEDLAKNAPTQAQRDWCREWRDRPSPEHFGDGPACEEPYPPVPEIAATEQTNL